MNMELVRVENQKQPSRGVLGGVTSYVFRGLKVKVRVLPPLEGNNKRCKMNTHIHTYLKVLGHLNFNSSCVFLNYFL